MHFATLTSEDVVRHSLVAKIVDAYTKYEDAKLAKQAAKKASK
jgi:phosphate starvation-inducible PhoH-like protein